MSVKATFRARTTRELEAYVTGLALASWSQLQDPPVAAYIPPLYSGQIRYKREEPNREHWQSAQETAERGRGDCEDLVAYRLAELWRAGELGAKARVLTISPTLRHVVVERADGAIEDPSKRLGMR